MTDRLVRLGNFCLKCGALDTDRARGSCTNPIWHWPNFRGEPEPVLAGVRLPYAED